MKKYLVNICLLIFCILVSGKRCYAEELVGQTIEAVLLIDTSKTMCRYEERLKKWSEDFCYNCAGKNITLSYVTFDNAGNEKEIIKRVKINGSNYKECVSKIQKASIEGNDTDQLGAFEKAKEILDNSNANIKYIIMLSDGQIDYGKFGKRDEKGEIIDKDKAEGLLKDSCKDFTGKNQRVILVGFGKDIKLFKDIVNEDDKEDREQLRIQYIDKSRNPSDVIKEFLNGTGNVEKVLEESKKEGVLTNNIKFKLKKKYDRVDIYMDNLINTKINFSKDISIYHNNKLLKENKFIFEDRESYLKVMLEFPEKGEYKVSLPKGKWYYKISYSFTQIKGARLALLSGNEEVGNANDKAEIITYEPGIFQSDLKLKAELQQHDEAKGSNIDVEVVCYVNTGENSDDNIEELWSDKSKVRQMIPNPDSNVDWKHKLDEVPNENNNIYQARVYLPDGSYVDSNKIRIVPKNEEIVDYSLDAVAGKETDLVSLLPEDYKKHADEMKFVLDDDVLGNIDNEKYISEKDGKIVTFKEAGEYTIDIQNKDNNTFARVVVNVKKGCFDNIPGYICENKEIFLAIGIIVVVLILIIIAISKKR